MPYVAKTPLRLTGKGGESITVLPGMAVPDFEAWSGPARRAHLEMGRVVQTDDLGAKVLSTRGGALRVSTRGAESMGEPVVKEAVEPINDWPCPHCDAEPFESRTALRKHVSGAHKD